MTKVLELVRNLLDHSHPPLTRHDAQALLQSTCQEYGFETGVLLEYGPDLKTVCDIVDSDDARALLWADILDREVVKGCVALTAALSKQSAVATFDRTYFAQNQHCLRAAEALGLLQGVAVPISDHAGLAGVVKFSGIPKLSEQAMIRLHTAAYLLFSTLQATRQTSANAKLLTPRERQVLEQTALGHTSGEISTLLGMSERTVNQHADNVAAKLGTRNRVHTVATLVRAGQI